MTEEPASPPAESANAVTATVAAANSAEAGSQAEATSVAIAEAQAEPPPDPYSTLRKQVTTATELITYKELSGRIEKVVGEKLSISDNLLMKFAKGTANLGKQVDIDKLTRFFEDPDTRAFLLGETRQAARMVSAHGAIDPEVAEILSAFDPRAHAKPPLAVFTGVYLARHASYLRDGHYAVRAMTFAAGPDGVSVTDYIKEGISSKGEPEHEARGVVGFEGEDALILLRRGGDDNAKGFNTIHLGRVAMRGPGRLCGHMIGRNAPGRWFTRAVILTPVDQGVTENEARRQTGVFPSDNLGSDPESHAEFAHLIQTVGGGLAWPDPLEDMLRKPNRHSYDNLSIWSEGLKS